MADLWDLSPVSSPAATDRIGVATGPGAGGYVPLGSLVWKSDDGFLASGLADAAYDFSTSLLVENQSFNVGSVAGLVGKTGDSFNGYLAFVRTGGYAGRFSLALNNGTGPSNWVEVLAATPTGVGIGTNSPAHKLSVLSSSEIARFATSTVRGSGNGYVGIGDPDGLKCWWGCGGGNDVIYLMNNMNASLVLGTNGVGRVTIDTAGNVVPGADNAQAFGGPSARWSVLHAATGTINTCDIRLKFYRAEPKPTADEHAAILECFEVFGFFQHLDAIERENDGGAPARWHFGPKAQEVWTRFANHGLAAQLIEDEHGDLVPPEGSAPPAFLCFDAWGEETAPVMAWWRPSDILGGDGLPIMVPCAEGEEGTEQRPTGETYVTREAGNIFGVRIDQLQSLMLVALHKRMNDLTDRVAALEPGA